MNGYFIAAIIVVVLAVAGYYLYKRYHFKGE